MSKQSSIDTAIILFMKQAFFSGSLYLTKNGRIANHASNLPGYVNICISVKAKDLSLTKNSKLTQVYRRMIKKGILIQEGDNILINPATVRYLKFGDSSNVITGNLVTTFEIMIAQPDGRTLSVASTFEE